MKKFLLALTGASLIALAACGGGTEPAPPAEEETPAEEEAPAEEAAEATEPGAEGTYDSAAAEALYQQSCAGCHGADLQGGGMYQKPITGLSMEEILAAIEQGPGAMPGGIATGAEAENLAAWIADK